MLGKKIFMMGIVMMGISCSAYAGSFKEVINRPVNLAAQVNYSNADDNTGIFNDRIIARYNGSLQIKNDNFVDEDFSICDGGAAVLELISTDWFSDCMDAGFISCNDSVYKSDFVGGLRS